MASQTDPDDAPSSQRKSGNENTAQANTKLLDKKTGTKEGTATLFVTVLNMVKLMIGSGMLSLPWAFAHVGIWPSVMAAIFCAGFDFVAAMLLIYSSEVSGIYEYSEILRPLGPIWQLASSVCLLYVVSGSLTGYLILIGDFISDIFLQCGVPATFPFLRQIIIIVATLLLTPLVLLKDLSSLWFMSFFGIAAITYVVVFLIYSTAYNLQDPDFVLGNANDNGSYFESANWNMGFFILTNVCTQAYVCHYSVQRVYLDLKQRTVKRMWIANGLSYLTVCVLYIAFGFCGYVLYGASCPSDVLIAFEGESTATTISVIIARLAMTISVCGTYPLAFVSCQANLHSNFFKDKSGNGTKQWTFEKIPWLRNAVILATQGVYLVLACIIPTIGPVVSVNGAVSTVGLICLFPIAGSWKWGFKKQYSAINNNNSNTEYMSVNNVDGGTDNGTKKDKEDGGSKISLLAKVLLACMLTIGVVFGVTGLIMEMVEV